jgi:hypothetical protein
VTFLRAGHIHTSAIFGVETKLNTVRGATCEICDLGVRHVQNARLRSRRHSRAGLVHPDRYVPGDGLLTVPPLPAAKGRRRAEVS